MDEADDLNDDSVASRDAEMMRHAVTSLVAADVLRVCR